MAQSYENVRLLIADPSPMVRTGLRGALFSIGFRTIDETNSYIKLHDRIGQGDVDLMILSHELNGNDTGFLVSEMRNQRLGSNPFALVITMLGRAEPEHVKRAIDSGIDDLVLTPVQPDQMIQRIQKLSRARKPFVVTHDYTGPDRRTKTRAFENQSAPMLSVPNPLRYWMEAGNVNPTRLGRVVDETASALNRLKIERHAVQLDWLVKHIHASIRDGVVAQPTTLVPHTTQLRTAAEDMLRRMRGTTAESFTALVSQLLETAKKLEADMTAVPFSELEHITTLSRAISRSLGSSQAAPRPGTPCTPAPVPVAVVT